MTAMLDGFTIGITADRRSDEQASLFQRRGATVWHGPTIRTLPLGGDDGLREVTEAVIAKPPAALIANTGIGIRSWFGSAESWDLGEALLEALSTCRIYARGPKASGAIHSLGLEVVARAASERLRECVEMTVADLEPGDEIVLQRDGGPTPPEAQQLRDAGFVVVEVPVYRWEPATDPRPALRLAEGVIGGRVHAVTFTAGPAITTWLDMAEAAGLAHDLRAAMASDRVVVGCVGPVCGEVATACGLGDDIVSGRTARLGPLVRAVAERLAATQRSVGPMVLTGNVVRVGDRRIELTDMEARVLAQLAERPGAVLSKTALLEAVWGDGQADPHLVEVAVARLRRRLGDAGRAIESVPRRGYVLR